MVVVKCRNVIIDKHEVQRVCDRFLGSVSDEVASFLKETSDAHIIYRCPQCASSKFIRISGRDGGLLQDIVPAIKIDHTGEDIQSVVYEQQLF